MLSYYYITGTSRGIGKAMAEYLLKNNSNRVTGISRTSSIRHENYRHITLDLTDLNKVKQFKFEKHESAARICLINNSGDIGPVKPAGKLSGDEIINNYNLNLIAPCLLMNNFINAFQPVRAEKIIVNVSSGAGKNPVDGWSIYCASKAGLDMFSRVADLEEKVHSRKNFRVLAIAPGVVDTNMQAQIRKASKENFSRLDDFIGYKNSGQLAKPETIAEKYFHLLDKLDSISEVVISAKDY